MNFQWYPGHMTKAKRMMQEDIKLIDLIIELIDARVPMSSRNPDIDELGKNKARLILLNKADLADERQTLKWMEYFQNKGFSIVKINSKNKADLKQINGVSSIGEFNVNNGTISLFSQTIHETAGLFHRHNPVSVAMHYKKGWRIFTDIGYRR